MNNIKEKAEKLGVPVLPAQPLKVEKEEIKTHNDQLKADLSAYATQTVAVCGACGKEISRKEESQGEPCGHNRCPFGTLHN